MSSIGITIRGDSELIARFERISTGVRAKMMETMNIVGIDMVGYVRSEKLSGQVLKRRTGQLSRSINNTVRSGESSVSAIVGANMAMARYAAAHEYGFTGTVTVPAHQRMQSMAWGRSITPRMVTVRQHPMQLNVTEKRYLRGSLAEKGPDELQKVRVAMIELIEKTR